jgi:hypothetical protein
VACTLASELAAGDPAQLGIDEWQQLMESGAVAAAPISKKRRDVVRRWHARPGAQDRGDPTKSQGFRS